MSSRRFFQGIQAVDASSDQVVEDFHDIAVGVGDHLQSLAVAGIAERRNVVEEAHLLIMAGRT